MIMPTARFSYDWQAQIAPMYVTYTATNRTGYENTEQSFGFLSGPHFTTLCREQVVGGGHTPSFYTLYLPCTGTMSPEPVTKKMKGWNMLKCRLRLREVHMDGQNIIEFKPTGIMKSHGKNVRDTH